MQGALRSAHAAVAARATSAAFVERAISCEVAAACVTAVATALVKAPYGRHDTAAVAWGPRMSAALGWMVMEAVSVWWFLWVYCASAGDAAFAFADARSVLAVLWLVHYTYRSFIYPVRAYGWPTFAQGPQTPTMPVLVAVLAAAFNTMNAFINGAWLGAHAEYAQGHLTSREFAFGTAVWAAGLASNIACDEMMLAQRAEARRGEADRSSRKSKYIIPRGFLFELVSAPNYLSEIVEWTGFATASGSPAASAFVVYVCSNLVPRALDHHSWYLATFGTAYPKNRRAIIPFLL